ncbi:purine nucleoside phosphoramidase [Porphyromonas macacae]|uniref:Purine nucleoside phosphoramidase n=2 Tax=Porphyromonas macacae TaxID=28115 RepID=A0A379E752_9PORP|nr:purine nucleoside phosphoramidase [Porphyromonas macacae]
MVYSRKYILIMSTVFSKIIRGEIPCHKIAESDRYFAFLDISPVTVGHVLVVPKQEIDYIFDLEDDLLSGMMLFAKRIAVAQKNIFDCKRVAVAVMGMEVPHAHIHLVPMNKEGDLNFAKEKLNCTQEELAAIAERIRGEYDRLAGGKSL